MTQTKRENFRLQNIALQHSHQEIIHVKTMTSLEVNRHFSSNQFAYLYSVHCKAFSLSANTVLTKKTNPKDRGHNNIYDDYRFGHLKVSLLEHCHRDVISDSRRLSHPGPPTEITRRTLKAANKNMRRNVKCKLCRSCASAQRSSLINLRITYQRTEASTMFYGDLESKR